MHSIISKEPPVLTKGVSQELSNFVSLCLKKRPGERASARALLEHNFMKQAHQGK
jgi:serine/threonine protein kinase